MRRYKILAKYTLLYSDHFWETVERTHHGVTSDTFSRVSFHVSRYYEDDEQVAEVILRSFKVLSSEWIDCYSTPPGAPSSTAPVEEVTISR